MPVLLALLFVPLVVARAEAVTNTATPAAVKTFLERRGFGGSPLQRRFGNHLFVTTMMDGKRTALLIDTGCPYTLIDRGSTRKIGLAVQETKSTVIGVFGTTERFGISHLRTLAMGNCTFVNVPVQVAEESEMNRMRNPHVDGLFGAHEMAKFGMIIDCTRQMIYVNPKGPSPVVKSELAEFLRNRGFTRIPMHLNARHHLEVEAAMNGHPTQLIVDTGSETTLISSSMANASGVSLAPLRIVQAVGTNFVPVNIGVIRELALGNLILHNAEVVVANPVKQVGGGLLGEEYLSRNFAILDVGGLSLYLRPPETR